jgi:IS5 family transposase
MSTFCSVCASSQQTLIDRRLLDGESLATLSADYGVPVRELRHHRDEHVLQRGTRRRPRRPAPLMD